MHPPPPMGTECQQAERPADRLAALITSHHPHPSIQPRAPQPASLPSDPHQSTVGPPPKASLLSDPHPKPAYSRTHTQSQPMVGLPSWAACRAMIAFLGADSTRLDPVTPPPTHTHTKDLQLIKTTVCVCVCVWQGPEGVCSRWPTAEVRHGAPQ